MPDTNHMFAPLSAEELSAATPSGTAHKDGGKVPIIPVPPDAPPLRFKHPKYGEPARTWPYHDAAGCLVGYAARFDFMNEDGAPDKDVLPLTFCDLGDGRRGWRSKAIPSPRPLYRLPELLADPDALVIVVEGEKKADRVPDIFPGCVGTCTAGGAKAAKLSDLSALSGRRVVIWPDHDAPGIAFADDVARLATEAGSTSVAVVHVPADWPVSWDIADEPPPGVTVDLLRAMIDGAVPWQPPADNPEDGTEVARDWPFRMVSAGVEKRIERTDRDTGDIRIEWKWFCSPLEIAADTRDTDGEAWGRLLRVTDRDGRTKEWAMPMAMLAGDGTAYRERLLSLGLILSPGRFARDALHEYISTARPDVKARCVHRIGWKAKDFVLTNNTFGDESHG